MSSQTSDGRKQEAALQVLGEQTPQSDGIMRAERPRLDRFGPVGKACHVAQSLFVIGPACNRCSFSASSTDVPLARPLRTPRSRALVLRM